MIKLFKATDKTYSTNGDVVLETAKARVHKEDNGDFYIDVEAPLKENKKEASYDEGQTIEGTDFSINVDLFKQNELTTLKGNTSQASTPTPDNPVPVNVVSGGQEINVCGSNIIGLDTQQYKVNLNAGNKITMKNQGTRALQLNLYTNYGDTTRNDYWSLQAGATRTITVARDTKAVAWNVEPNGLAWANKGEISLSYEEYTSITKEINLGKNLLNNIATTQETNGITFTVNSDKSITISGTATADAYLYLIGQNNFLMLEAGNYTRSATLDGNDISGITLQFRKDGYGGGDIFSSAGTRTRSATLTETTKTTVRLRVVNGTEISTPITIYPMLVKGNYKAGSALSYAPYKTPIELCKINDYQDFIRKGTGKNLFDKDNVNALVSYISSRGVITQSGGSDRTIYIPCEPNTTYTIQKMSQNPTSCNRFRLGTSSVIPENGVALSDFINNSNGTTKTSQSITTGNNAKYLCIFIFTSDNSITTFEEMLNSIQIELGSQATLFEPYGYKDKWYLYKTIGKVVLNGSENWQINKDKTYVYQFYFNHFANDLNLSDSEIKSNYFKYQTGDPTDTTNEDYTWVYRKALIIDIRKSITSSLADFKTWLSTHNTIVYYILSTPTTTEITDSELISQLEGIELLQGLNNVSVSSGDLPGIITIHYNYVNGYNTSIKYIDYLVPNNIIVANTPQGEQAFRISNVENTRTKIKIKAYHVFYDTENLLIEDSYVVDKNCNDALDHLNNATSDTSPFTTISNINTIANYRCVRKSLYEAIQVVLDRWGGHLVRNNWTIGIYDTIGQDNGVTIRYAKNLKNITATYIWDDVVTKLLPVGKDGLLLNAIDPDASIYVESAMQYDIPYTKTISFSQNSIVEDDYKDESGTLDEDAYKQALVDDLYAQAIEYINNNYLPKVNYNLSANVEKVSDIGDTIEVIDEKLGINVMTHIISYDYDCILDKYIELQFGNFTPQLNSLLQTINDNTEKIVQEENNTLAITLGRELDEATSKIWGALGNSYVIYDGDKILVVDSLPKETATNVIMINNGGIGFSNTGITGTFNSAWTIDNVLNMEQINVINLTADLIKGGTLKLGSNLNQNGKIEVFDEANNLIAELNKNGLKMYGVDGSYVLMNNQVGFAGYDRNNNKIYWVDKDEFHMKKSVVEEEITLVGKMRIIPITIRNGNTIVNDGIGFINVAS